MSHAFLQNLLHVLQQSRQPVQSCIRLSECKVNSLKVLYCQRHSISQHNKKDESPKYDKKNFSNRLSKSKERQSERSDRAIPSTSKVVEDDNNDFFGLNESLNDHKIETPVRFLETLPQRYKKSERRERKKEMFTETLYGHIRYDKKAESEIKSTSSYRNKNKPETLQVNYSRPPVAEISSTSNDRRFTQKPYIKSEISLSKNRSGSYVDEQYFAYDGSFGKSVGSDIKNKDAIEHNSAREKELDKNKKVQSVEEETIPESAGSQYDLGFVDGQYFSDVKRDLKKQTKNIHNSSVASADNAEELERQKIRHYDNDFSEVDKQYFVETCVTNTFQPKSNSRNSYNDQTDEHKEKLEELRDRKLFLKRQNVLRNSEKMQKHPGSLSQGNKQNQTETSKSAKTDGEETAYDMSQKIRREKEQSRDVNLYGKMLPNEYDSKGFHILRNQVPHFNNAPALDVRTVLRKAILYDKHDIVAINKPYGLAFHDGPGIVHCVSHFLDSVIPRTQLYPVHRLDKETTGVMLFAKTESMAKDLSDRFMERDVRKRYLAITKNVPKLVSGEIDIPISEAAVNGKVKLTLTPHYSEGLKPVMKRRTEGMEAVTRYRVLDQGERCALLECIPVTGKKHQIRVHLAFGIDCPVLGDHKYAHFNKMAPMKLHPAMLRLLHIQQSKVRYLALHLHARSIFIPEFLNGKNLFVAAWLPPHFLKNMKSLKLKLPKNM